MKMLLAAACVVSACAAGCAPEQPPEFVYLRTDAVNVTVTVTTEPEVAVDTWLPLRATRTTTGAWRQVPYRDVPEGTAWMGYVPPEREDEVAANLRWFAEPAEGVAFDSWVPKPVPIEQRAVKFAKPGTYRLWATSHAPLDATSNTLQVRVLPR